jgi:glycosyl transferase, family 25
MSEILYPGLMVLLINLDRSDQRRSQMEQRLAALGLPYERLPAVDGKRHWPELKTSVNISEFQRNVGRDLMQGEIGCYHSHLLAWNRLIASDAQTLLVLEDDVVFGQDFLAALGQALRHRDQWDILKLNKIRAKQPVPQAQLGTYALNAYIGPLTGMGAYLITREIATRLMPAMLPIQLPIDLELDQVYLHRIRHYGLEPFPSYVNDENQSTITGAAFSGVHKYPRHRRLASYRRRLGVLLKKLTYLIVTGRIFPRSHPL